MIEAICREPYRIFFPLGILAGLYGVTHWFFYAIGWLEGYSGFLHSSVQMQIYIGSFVIGFLLTAMPRMASLPHANPIELFLFLGLLLGVFIFGNLNLWALSSLCYLSWLSLLFYFIISRIQAKLSSRNTSSEKKSIAPPTEFVWIPMAIFYGITGSVLIMLGQFELIGGAVLQLGVILNSQGFIVTVVLGVGSFLAPRLTGRYRMPIDVENKCSIEDVKRFRKVKALKHLSLCVLLFVSFYFEAVGYIQGAYLLRGVIALTLFLWTGILPLVPRVKDFYAWLVWLSFWFVVLGFFGAGLFPDYRKVMLHLTFLGGFSLMTYAVGTMVTLSHAGEAEELKKPLLILKIILLGVILALCVRFLAVYKNEFYFQLLGLSAVIWGLTAFAWLFLSEQKF